MSTAPPPPPTAALSRQAPSPAEPVPAGYDEPCEGCGYSLLGLASDRCPECGRPFDPAGLPLAQVPWLYRRQIGPARAYVRTVWRVLRNPSAFAAEVCRPVRVSADDARRFRLVTVRVVQATGLVVALAALAAGVAAQGGPSVPTAAEWVLAALAIVVGTSALGLYGRLATDLPTFIWRGSQGRENDLAPLHHYACAPMALWPIVATAALGATALAAGIEGVKSLPGTDWFAAVLLPVAGLPAVLVVLDCWLVPLHLMRRATGCGPGRVAAMAAYLPVHWAMMAFVCVVGGFGVFWGAIAAVESLTGVMWGNALR